MNAFVSLLFMFSSTTDTSLTISLAVVPMLPANLEPVQAVPFAWILIVTVQKSKLPAASQTYMVTVFMPSCEQL